MPTGHVQGYWPPYSRAHTLQIHPPPCSPPKAYPQPPSSFFHVWLEWKEPKPCVPRASDQSLHGSSISSLLWTMESKQTMGRFQQNMIKYNRALIRGSVCPVGYDPSLCSHLPSRSPGGVTVCDPQPQGPNLGLHSHSGIPKT